MISINRQFLQSKVPQITLVFWITKILTTGMGETTSDFMVHAIDPVIAVGLCAIGLAVSLLLQFAAHRYLPWVYWSSVVMVSVFGTMAADVLHIGLGIPYIASSIFFTLLLALVFIIWYGVEKTLSIHHIHTRRRELFYWLAVLTTFALGTATGDMTATTLHLGYFISGLLFMAIFAVPALGYWKLGLNGVAAFWLAYIVTRPLGASFADWLGVSHARNGLGWGTGWVSLALAGLIVVFVSYLALTHEDVEVE